MQPKVILITGSSRGLGAHAAYRFASKGHTVIINCSRSKDEAEILTKRIQADFGSSNAISIQADVSKRDEVGAMFDTIYSRFGICDALVNMAGVNRDNSFAEMNDEEWQVVLQTVLTGTFVCCQEYARRYQGNSGQIVNIGAVTGIRGRKNGANYCSARAGVLNLTRCIALELAPKINVNSLTPGYIETDEVMTRHSLHIKENYDRAIAPIPAGRLGSPEDIFNALEFLVNSSSYITGQNLMVDGGILMR